MKHVVTISFDDETKETEMTQGGKVYRFSSHAMETRRDPVADLEAEEKSGAGYRILKPGPELEFHFRGTILSESDA